MFGVGIGILWWSLPLLGIWFESWYFWILVVLVFRSGFCLSGFVVVFGYAFWVWCFGGSCAFWLW